VPVNFAGIFLGLLLLGTGAAGFLLSTRVNALAAEAGHELLGFEPGKGGTLPPAADMVSYVAIDTEPISPLGRALSLLWLTVLVGTIAAFTAFTIWSIGTWLFDLFLSQFTGD
jgi:hypothetical protein